MITLLSPDLPWLTFRQHDGHTTAGAVCDLVLPAWADVDAPRADFRGAIYQLLIGLLQARLAPDTRKEWPISTTPRPRPRRCKRRWPTGCRHLP